MSELKVRTRETGAVAEMPQGKLPVITTPTGGVVELVTSVSQAGFNPLDLIYSSVAACMALSARIAATKLELREKLTDVRVEVKGDKAHEGPSRIERFNITFHFGGDLTDDEKHRLAEMAEEICTVSNTLRGEPQFDLKVS
ncbi:OsmC family protein [Brucella anthropi]|uniref:OsmC family protein n=1 Tax=Brucella anthropi TaxID=529 RepID=UPI003D980980